MEQAKIKVDGKQRFVIEESGVELQSVPAPVQIPGLHHGQRHILLREPANREVWEKICAHVNMAWARDKFA